MGIMPPIGGMAIGGMAIGGMAIGGMAIGGDALIMRASAEPPPGTKRPRSVGEAARLVPVPTARPGASPLFHPSPRRGDNQANQSQQSARSRATKRGFWTDV